MLPNTQEVNPLTQFLLDQEQNLCFVLGLILVPLNQAPTCYTLKCGPYTAIYHLLGDSIDSTQRGAVHICPASSQPYVKTHCVCVHEIQFGFSEDCDLTQSPK